LWRRPRPKLGCGAKERKKEMDTHPQSERGSKPKTQCLSDPNQVCLKPSHHVINISAFRTTNYLYVKCAEQFVCFGLKRHPE
jgi:hypothetical protein